MLNVSIPWDLTTALVKMDFMEMELTAQVTVCNISGYFNSFYFSDVTPRCQKSIDTNKRTLIKHNNKKAWK